ncbi:RNA polymerase II-associated protein 1-like [Babylonia areolata]|uniref:RNA polymerase II-associated protein 1-like n=1 Tax=Babylonia areolata TaxID=304850 RepID=UPI003FD0FCC3
MERSNLGNNEDELLKFQEEFMASKTKPAVSIIKKSEKRKSVDPPRDVVHMDTLPHAPPSLDVQPPKKSRFRVERERKQKQMTTPETDASGPFLDPEEMVDRQDRGLAAILSSIIERDTRNAAFTMPKQSTQAFPTVIKNSDVTKGGSQQQSVFAQQVAQRGVQDFGVSVPEEVSKMEVSDLATFSSITTATSCGQETQQGFSKSRIVDGHGLSVSQAEEEAQSIHKENLAKLTEMSQEEILAEQQQLLQLLDPGLVEFLKAKSRSGEKTGTDQSAAHTPAKSAKPEQIKQQPTQSGNAADVPEAVPMEGQKKWVHMDKVEYDKLEWMKDLPPPSADHTQTGQQARFDFQGNVIAADADIPVNRGLHHHGDEPERAGYSIGELFQLARSTNIQQRVLALGTLSSIIHKAKEGSLDDLIQTPIIPSLLDAGVIFLLRWACDDSVDAAVAAAVSALCALVCNPADEAALDRVSPWYQGNCVPAMVPPATVEQMAKSKTEEDEDSKVEETDAEVAKRDLIQGLMSRMMLQERLFYILDTRQPQAPTVVCILCILTRVARHSTQMAYEISRNTKLMNLIFHNFLPITWVAQASDHKAVSSVYGRPLAAAMRLAGSLCQAGRHIASVLDSTYSLQNILLGYLAVSTDCLLLSPMEAESLQKESLITWRILLSYGLAADVFLKIYQPLMDQLTALMSRLTNVSGQQPMERDVLFLSALEGVVPVAASPPVRPGFSQSQAAYTETSVTSSINWSQVESLRPLVRLCAEQCLTHLAENYTQQKPSLQFPAVCVNFMATFYSKWEGQSSQSAVDVVQQVEQFCLNSLAPFLKSWGFTSIVASLCSSSSVLLSSEWKRREAVSCLPELGCDGQGGRVPLVGESSPVGFLLALCRLVLCACRIHRGVSEQTAAVILSHEDVTSYLRKVTTCSTASHLHSNHFTRMETLLQYFLVKLSTLVSVASRPPMMHQLTLDIMSRLLEGEEFLAQDLMSTVLFSADFIPEGQAEELAAASMADLKISRTHILKSATQEEITTNNCQLLTEAIKSLPMIRAHYFRAFAHMEGKVAQSRCRYQQLPRETASLMDGGWESSLMPQDWVFLPLVDLHNRFVSATSESQRTVETSSIPVVTSAVQWIFLVEMWRSRSLSHVSVTLKISRLMCVFLGGNELFLEKSVYPYLASLFRLYTTPRLLSAMDFDENIPGISFYDLYMLLLEQFEAVSYGDPVFAAFVLLPMQQCHSCLLRRAVWQERSLLLRAMTLPVQEMLIDVDRFLSPEETDPRLLQLYAGSLMSGTVQQRWSPLLFLVAVHHLNRFLFRSTQDDTHGALQRSLWDMVLRCPDQSLRETIIHFKQVDRQGRDCLERYAPLPAHRQQLVDQHRQRLGGLQ